MAVQDRPVQIEFTAGARVAFSSLSNQLQNKLYSLVGRLCQDSSHEKQMENEGVLKSYRPDSEDSTYILRLNNHIRAYIQVKESYVLISNILNKDLAKRYSD